MNENPAGYLAASRPRWTAGLLPPGLTQELMLSAHRPLHLFGWFVEKARGHHEVADHALHSMSPELAQSLLDRLRPEPRGEVSFCVP